MAIQVVALPLVRKFTELERVTGKVVPSEDCRFEAVQVGGVDQVNDLLEDGWKIIYTGDAADVSSLNAIFVLYKPDAAVEADQFVLAEGWNHGH